MPKYDRGKVVIYDRIPDDIYQLLKEYQSEFSQKLGRKVSISFVITKLLKHLALTSERIE